MAIKSTSKPIKKPGRSAMVRILIPVVAVFLAIGLYFILRPQAATTFPTSRNMYKWPFSRFSIWNMPIGKGAEFVPANYPETLSYNGEENILILDPNAPQRNVYQSANNGWEHNNADRCAHGGGVLISNVLIPDNYNGAGPDGLTYVWLKGMTPVNTMEEAEIEAPNGAGAILKPDKRTVVQTQPLVACGSGDNVTSHWYGDGDRNDDLLDGEGIVGAQGGSGMSSVGGTLRMGELTKDSGNIYHALKMTVEAGTVLYFDNNGWRWPAFVHDSYANKDTYRGTNPEIKQGALLALPSSVDINSLGLTTEPGKKIAWTLQKYGVYAVDDSACSCANIAVEHGPDGSFLDQFEAEWGYPFRATGLGDGRSPWKKDLDTLFANLSVVKNNAANKVGGGGDPLVCYAPKLDGETKGNPNGSVTEPADCGVGGSEPTPTPTGIPLTPTPTPTTGGPTPTPNPNGSEADLNNDGIVNVLDLSKLIINYKKTGATREMGDIDGDGTVTITDLSLLVRDWGT